MKAMSLDTSDLPMPCDPDIEYRTQHDFQGGTALSVTVITAIAEAAGVCPRKIRMPLFEVVDIDTLDRSFQPRPDGTSRVEGALSFSYSGYAVTIESDGTVTVESELAALRRRGGNLLVVGAVPDEAIDELSALLLGALGSDGTAVFVLCGRDVSAARRRLSRADGDVADATVIAYRSETRSSCEDATSRSDLSVQSVSGDLSDLRCAIEDVTDAIDCRRGGSAPTDLHLCIDSIAPLVNEHDDESVRTFLERILQTTRERADIGYCILPVDRGEPAVQRIEPLFEGVVELRIDAAKPQQRWELHRTSFSTSWCDL